MRRKQKISIDPENEGSFTAFAKRRGMSVQEAAQHVLDNRDQYAPARVKQANFARNASKWKHQEGGSVGMPAIPRMQMGGDAQQVKAALVARYGPDWEKKATPEELKQYYDIQAQAHRAFMGKIADEYQKFQQAQAIEKQKRKEQEPKLRGVQRDAESIKKSREQMQRAENFPGLESASERMKAGLVAQYGANWENTASPREVQQYYAVNAAENQEKERQAELLPYLQARTYLDNAQKTNDSLLEDGFHPWDGYQNARYSTDLVRYMEAKHPELVAKELGREKLLGKTMLLAGKYAFPEAAPAFDWINNGIDAVEFAQNPNDTMNQAQVAADLLSPFKSRRLKIKPFGVVGDILDAVEIANDANKYARGGISTQGYKANSPDRFNSFNIIPSNQITMQGVPHPVMGVDNLGNQQLMLPGYQYIYPGSYVVEHPVAAPGRYQVGGQKSPFTYLNLNANPTIGINPAKVTDSMVPNQSFQQINQQRVNEAQNFALTPGANDPAYMEQHNPVAYQRAWLRNYVNSDKYRQRLVEGEGFSEADALKEQQARVRNLESLEPDYTDNIPSPKGTRILGQYKARSEPGDKWDPKSQSWVSISTFPFRSQFGTLQLLDQYRKGNTIENQNYRTTPLHEYSHSLDAAGSRIPFGTSLRIFDNTNQIGPNSRRINGNVYGYTNTPTEFLARMNVVRYLLDQQGIYNASKQDFDPDFYDAMMKNPTIQNNANFKQIFQTLKGNDEEKKQRFIQLMNTIAYNNNNGEGSTVAQEGGTVGVNEPGTSLNEITMRKRSYPGRQQPMPSFPGYQYQFPGNLGLLPKLADGGGYTGSSIVDYLNAMGIDSSKSSRKQLADQWGIKNYTGTAAQNLALLDVLRSGQGPVRDNNKQKVVPAAPVQDRPEVVDHPGPDPLQVHPKNGYVNLADYGVKLYNDDGYTYSPEAIQFAIDVQKNQPDQKVKFVCNQKGCFAIANRASEGLTGKRLTGPGAWQTDGNTIWQSPAMKAYQVGSGQPLPNPKEADYNIPTFMNQLSNVFVKLDRTNNRVNGAAQTAKAADDSYDYANPDFFPESTGNEHIGYIPQPGWLLHGAAKGANHPAFFVLENLLKNKNISLPGYGRYAPVAVVSTSRGAAPIAQGGNEGGGFWASLGNMLGFAQGGETGSGRGLKKTGYYKDGGTKPGKEPDRLYKGPVIKPGDVVRYSLRENKDDTPEQHEFKQKLVDYFNDRSMDARLMKQTGMPIQDLQGLKPVLFGIAGNESTFDNMSWQRALKEYVSDPFPGASVGPLQIKGTSVAQNIRDEFDVNSWRDLHDPAKAYAAGLSVLYSGKPLTDTAIARGKQPGLVDADPYFRYAYAYNMPAMVRGGDDRIKQLWKRAYDNDANKRLIYREGQQSEPLTDADMEAFINNKRLRLDPGSYPYKAQQNAYDLITTVLSPEEAKALEAEEAARNPVRGPLLAAPNQAPAYITSPFGPGLGAPAPATVQQQPSNKTKKAAAVAKRPAPLMPPAVAVVPQPGWNVFGNSGFENGGMYAPEPLYGAPFRYQEGGERLVNTVPKDYTPMGKKNGKDFYYKDAAVSVPEATGTGPAGENYEAFIKQQLAAGVSPQELVNKRYIDKNRMPYYAQFYVPKRDVVYTQPPAPVAPPASRPFTGFSGSELYDPRQHLAALYKFATRKSADANDPGTLNSSQQMAQVMMVDNMGRPDPTRYYEIPASEFSNKFTNGVKTLRDTSGISQYLRPFTGMPSYDGGGVYANNFFNGDPTKPSSTYNDTGLYPYGVINPFDIDPYQNKRPFGNTATKPASGPTIAPPAAPSLNDNGLYPYGVINPFDMDPYELQRRSAAQNTSTPASFVQPGISAADKLKPGALNTSTVADMATASALATKAKWAEDAKNAKTKPGQTNKDPRFSGIDYANALIGGMSIFNSIAEAAKNNQYAKQNQFHNWGDAVGSVVSNNRGATTTNEGYMFPDQKTPVQFAARQMAQLGGGYYSEPTSLEPIPMGPMPVIPETNANTYADIPAPETPQTPTKQQAKFNIPSFKPNNHVKLNDAAWQAYDYYTNEKGLSPVAASGILANLFWESQGMQTDIKEKGNTGNGRGLAQWDVRDRWQNLQNWAEKNKLDPYNLHTQLDYVLEEPGESSKALKALANAKTPEEASYIFGKIYERPAEKYANWDMRAALARKFYDGKQPPKENMAKQAYGGQFQYQQGGEYIVTPKQLEFILANGGEVDYL